MYSPNWKCHFTSLTNKTGIHHQQSSHEVQETAMLDKQSWPEAELVTKIAIK